MLFTLAVFLITRITIIFSSGTDIGGIEQNVVYSVQTYLYSGKLYTSPSAPPFSITQYTPLYYYVCSLTASALGTSYDNLYELYRIGRSWSLVFNLGTAYLMFRIASTILGVPMRNSLFIALLSLALNLQFNFAMRSDSLTDLMGITSLYSFLLYLKSPPDSRTSIARISVAIFFTALAVFSKQSGIQLIIIFVGYSIISRDWKTFFRLILIGSIIYYGLFSTFSRFYPSFFDNTIGGISNGILLLSLLNILRRYISILMIFPLLFATSYFIIKNRTLSKGTAAQKLMALFCIGTFVFATVTALKMGSTAQYYILFVNSSLLFYYSSIQNIIGHKSTVRCSDIYNRLTICSAVFFCGLMLVNQAYNIKLLKTFDIDPAIRMQRRSAVDVVKYIKNDVDYSDKSYVFSNLTVDYTLPSRQSINNAFFKNCLVPQMDILEASTGPSKVIGYHNLRQLLQSGKVRYLIESRPSIRFNILDDMENIKSKHFAQVADIDGYMIYKYQLKP